MTRAGAELPERSPVPGNRIALVPCKAVAGMLGIQLLHQRVAGGLGEDRGRGNRQALGIASDDGLLGNLQALETAPIDQHVLGLFREPLDRAVHGEPAGPVDVDTVDLLDRGETHRPGGGRLLDLAGETIPRSGIELL